MIENDGAKICCAYCRHEMLPDCGSSFFWYRCSSCGASSPRCTERLKAFTAAQEVGRYVKPKRVRERQ